MKYFILIFLTMSAMANYVPESKIGSGERLTVFMKLKKCESHYNEKCTGIPIGYNASFHVLQDEMIDDLTKPIWDKTNIVNCADQAECDASFVALVCSDSLYEKIKNYDLLQVYCVKIVSYEPKPSGYKHIAIDKLKKSNYEEKMLSKKLTRDAISGQLKDMEYGKTLYASIQLLSKKKKLTKKQRRLFRKNNRNLRDDLFEGNLCQVRSDLLVLAVDGVMITSQAEIDGIVSKIDAYKSCI